VDKQEPRTSLLAVTSLVVVFVGFILSPGHGPPIFTAFAIPVGLLAMLWIRLARPRGSVTGYGVALSAIGLSVFLMVWGWYDSRGYRHAARMAGCQNNLKQNFEGKLSPIDWRRGNLIFETTALFPSYLDFMDVTHCPANRDHKLSRQPALKRNSIKFDRKRTVTAIPK